MLFQNLDDWRGLLCAARSHRADPLGAPGPDHPGLQPRKAWDHPSMTSTPQRPCDSRTQKDSFNQVCEDARGRRESHSQENLCSLSLLPTPSFGGSDSPYPTLHRTPSPLLCDNPNRDIAHLSHFLQLPTLQRPGELISNSWCPNTQDPREPGRVAAS